MHILVGLIAGVIGYFIAGLVFNSVISGLIGIVIALAIIFGYDRRYRI